MPTCSGTDVVLLWRGSVGLVGECRLKLIMSYNWLLAIRVE